MSKRKRGRESECESWTIAEGYAWFNVFKRLLVDVSFSPHLLLESQDRFAQISARKAINLIAIELSFLYDILHTKAVHKHCILGRVLHCSSLVSIIVALVVFHHLDKQTYVTTDIIITYILFGAGLGIEVIATFLLVFSDWTVVSLRKKVWCQGLASVITSVVKGTLRKGKPRWSKTIGQYNLVGLCLRDKDTKCAWIMRKLKIKHKWDNMCETSLIPMPELLEEYMFTEALRRALNMHKYSVFLEARSYKGRNALERHGQLSTIGWSMDKEFDECIILWHVATDICYYNEFTPNQSNRNNTAGDVSWKTSNYMVYLLTQQQSMMQLGYGKKRIETTCDVVRKMFKGKGKLEDRIARKVLVDCLLAKQSQAPLVLKQNEEAAPVPDDGRQHGWRCWGNRKGMQDKRKNEEDSLVPVQIYAPEPDDGHQPEWICWGTCKSKEEKRKSKEEKRKDQVYMGKLVIMEGLKLAKQLQAITPATKKWELISETWMEMLGYAAIHCDSYQHARTLSRGGELLTHFWLLMAHMGMVEEKKMQHFQAGFV